MHPHSQLLSLLMPMLLMLMLMLSCTLSAADKITWSEAKDSIDCNSAKKYACGTVASVHDGDTLRLSPDYGGKSLKIRLIQIDSPELSQAFGPQSQEALATKVPLGSRVCVVSPGNDHFGRVLGFVCSGGVDMNAWLLANGLAWCYRNSCSDKYRGLVMAARREKLGLWAAGSRVAPWVYRKRQRRLRRKGRL